MFRKILIGIAVIFLWMSTLSFSAPQYFSKKESSLKIRQDEKLTGDLITMKEEVYNEGLVVGDVFFLGRVLENGGTINGDILSVVNQLEIEGLVKGDVRTWTNKTVMSGEINRSVTIITQKMSLSKEGIVDGSITAIGDLIEINGVVGSDLRGSMDTLIINGRVKGDVEVTTSHIILGPQAEIGGNLTYQSKEEKEFNPNKIVGKVFYHKPFIMITIQSLRKWIRCIRLMMGISLKLNVYAMAICLILCFPAAFVKIREGSLKGGFKIPIVGLSFVIGVPILAGLLLLTVIGIPLALILIGLYYLAIFFSKIILGDILGNWVLGGKGSPVFRMILGLLLIDCSLSIDLLQIGMRRVLLIFGFGLLYYFLKERVLRYE